MSDFTTILNENPPEAYTLITVQIQLENSNTTQSFLWDPLQSLSNLIQGAMTLFDLQDTTVHHYCIQLSISQDSYQLITSDNKHIIVKEGSILILCLNSHGQCFQLYSQLQNQEYKDPSTYKKALFALQHHFKETVGFADIFIELKGQEVLFSLLDHIHGNALAYGLSCLLYLEERYRNSISIPIEMLSKLCAFVEQENNPNIVRPATILIVLDIELESQLTLKQKKTSILLKQHPLLFSKISARIEKSDYTLQHHSLQLINLILECAESQEKRSKYIYDLDDLGIRKILLKCAQQHPAQELSDQIIRFEILLAKEFGKRKRMRIDKKNPSHVKALSHILGVLRAHIDNPNANWSDFGFSNDSSPIKDLDNVGVMGLELLYILVCRSQQDFVKVNSFFFFSDVKI